jgi:hypothetical protein
MDDTDFAPRRTILNLVVAACLKIDVRTLAGRAGVPKRAIVDVTRGGINHDAGALRRLLAAAEAAIANDRRHA